MNSELFFDKKRYISTKESSKISGYSSDYIGQLCRSGKLDCKRISNTWFIFSDSLDEYIKQNGKPSKVLKIAERKKVDQNKNYLEKNTLDKKLFPLYRHSPFLFSVFYGRSNRHGLSSLPLIKKILTTILISLFFISLFTNKDKIVYGSDNLISNFSNINLEKISFKFYENSRDILNFYSYKLFSNYQKINYKLSDIVKNQKNNCSRVDCLENIAISFYKSKQIENLNSNILKSPDYLLAQTFGIKDTFDFSSVSVYKTVQNTIDKTADFMYSLFPKPVVVFNNIYTKSSTTNSTIKNIKNTNPISVIQTKVIYEYKNNPVSKSNINQEFLDKINAETDIKLQQLNNSIMSKFYNLSTGTGGNVTNIYQQIAHTQRIDNLSGTSISSPIITGGTISGASISGGTLTVDSLSATLAGLGTTTITNLSVTNTSTSTFSGPISVNSNSATSTFANGIDLSGGCFSVNGVCMTLGGGGGSGTVNSSTGGQIGYFGSNGNVISGTSTVFISTDSKVGISTTSPFEKLSVVGNIFATGNITGANITATGTLSVTGNTTLTNATSTNFAITGITSSLLKTNSSGSIIQAISGTDYQAPLTFTYPLTNSANTISLAFGTTTANTWSALQQFANSSTTLASIYNALYVGSTATTTILGNATSTFGAGIQASYLNITGNTATSTFANGIDLSGGCFSVNGVCIGSSSGLSFGKSFEINSLGYLAPTTSVTVLLPNGFVSQASSTIIGNATTTGTFGVGRLFINNDYITDFTGTGLNLSSGVLSVDYSGNWTGTFDGQEGSYYLSRSNHTGQQNLSTISNYDFNFANNFNQLNITSSSTMPFWSTGGINASSTSNFVNASTTQLTVFGNSYLNSLNLSSSVNSILSTDSFGNVISTSTPTFGFFNATSTTATSTIIGALQINKGLNISGGYIFGAGLSSCSGSADKLIYNSTTGQFGCGADAGAGGGITAIGAQYSSYQTGSTQTFATSTDTNIGLTITSSGDTHTFTPTWSGTLSVSRGGTGASSFTSGQILYGTGTGALSSVATGTVSSSGGISTTANRYVIGGNLSITCDVASGSQAGCLSSSDWTTFNNKQSALTFTYPLTNSANTISLAFGTTTANTWSALQQFANASSTILSAYSAYIGGTATTTFTNDGFIGLGTTTPFARLSVNSEAGQPAFVVGSSTATSFIVDSSGRVGVGTSTPSSNFQSSISGSQYVSGSLSVGSVNILGTGPLNLGSLYSVSWASNTVNFSLGHLGTFFRSRTGSLNVGSVPGTHSMNFDTNLTGSSGDGAAFAITPGIAQSGTASYTALLVNAKEVTIGSGSRRLIDLQTSTTTRFMVDANGYTSISTTTSSYLLTVASSTAPQLSLSAGAGFAQTVFRNDGTNFYISTTTIDGTSTTTTSALEIALTGFGTTTLRGLNIQGQATSTSNVGLNITTGCFAVNGVCVGGSGSSASSTLLADFNTFTNTNNFTNKIGLSTSSPFAKLSVNSVAGEPAFVVGSSTATSFIVDSNGNVGIGTSTPTGLFTISSKSGSQLFRINESTGNAVFGNTAPSVGTKLSVQGVLGIHRTGASPIADMLQLSSSDTGAIINVQSNTNPLIFQTNTGTERMRILANGNIGIGTTTPYYNLTIASTTGAQLSLSEGAGIAQWTQRNAGGNLYFATTTIDGISTTTTSALTILNNGNIGIGTTTPNAYLTVSPTSFPPTTPVLFLGTSSLANASANGTYFGINSPASFIGNLVNIQGNNADILTITQTSATPNFNITVGPSLAHWQYQTSGKTFDMASDVGFAWSNATAFSNANDLGVRRNNPGVLEVNTGTSGSLATLITRNIGIGTTTPGTSTPFALLQLSTSTASTSFRPQLAISDQAAGTNAKHWTISSQGGNFYLATSTDTYATSSISALEISGQGFGTTTLRGLNIVGQATSTSNVGLNITNGCFAVNGSCISNTSIGSSISSATAGSVLFAGASGVLTQDNANFYFDDTNNRLGLGTTTPFAKLSVNSVAGEPAFVIGSSTETSLIVDSLGNVGINNLVQSGRLHVKAKSTDNAALALDQGNSSNPWLIQFSRDGFSSAYVQLTAGNTLGWQAIMTPYNDNDTYTLGTALKRWNAIYIGTGDSQFDGKLTVNSNIAISTTTPFAQLSINSQAGQPAFVVGSSTATSFIVDKNGNVGVGTASPSSKFDARTTLTTTDNVFGNYSLNTTFNPSSNSSSRWFNTAIESSTSGGNSMNELSNLFVAGYHQGTNILSNLRGIQAETYNYNGTTTNSSALSAFVQNAGTGTTTNAYGLNITQIQAYSGSILNSYGVYIGSIDGTLNKFGIYQSDSTNKNYFAGNLGISTTSPFEKLSVVGNIFATGNITGSNITATGTLSVTGNTTLSNASSTILSAYTAYIGGTATTTFTNTGLVGIGTSTPFARLSINSLAGESAFVVGSSTATSFIVDRNGNSGFGTSTPSTNYRISATGGIYSSGNVVVSGTLTTISGTGTFSVNGNIFTMPIASQLRCSPGSSSNSCLLVTTLGSRTTTSGTVNNFILNDSFDASTGTADYSSFTLNNTINQGVAASGISRSIYINPIITRANDFRSFEIANTLITMRASIGQSYSGLFGQLIYSSSTASTISTSTNITLFPPASGANVTTSTSTALYIQATSSTASSGVVQDAIGALIYAPSGGTRNSALYTVGPNYMSGLTNSTGAGSLCLDANNQVVFVTEDACLPSLRETKHNIENLSVDAISILENLNPVSFAYNQGDGRTRFGFIAEEASLVNPKLGTYNLKGDLIGIDDRAFLSVLVKGVKEIWDKVKPILAWFEGGKFNVKGDVCVDDVCVSKEQFKAMLINANTGNSNSGGNTSNNGNNNSENTDTTSPIITINGDNPASIQVGQSYIDLGATVTDTDENGNVNNNLGIQFTVNGVSMTEISIDTSTTTSHTIVYSSIDAFGNTGYATRTVEVLGQ